jgi:non-ribosomal peptide synthetase-like protein
LGNPAMFLPNRQQPHGSFDASTTYHPSCALVFGRVCIEFVKMILPFTLFIMSMLMLMGDFQLIRGRFHESWHFWLIWPLLYMGAGVGCCFLVVLAKWLLIGKYVAGEHPLWSSFIWRHDLVTSLLDSLAYPYFITHLRGTPFVCLFFRLLGVHIGSRVWMDTCAITEPDLVHIGDDTALHNDAQIQTHLFEDRILKMSHLHIGNKCSSQSHRRTHACMDDAPRMHWLSSNVTSFSRTRFLLVNSLRLSQLVTPPSSSTTV